MESDESEGEDSEVRDNRPYEMRTYVVCIPWLKVSITNTCIRSFINMCFMH